jgi:hypothetical protein
MKSQRWTTANSRYENFPSVTLNFLFLHCSTSHCGVLVLARESSF